MDCDVDTLAEASKCFVAGLSDEQLDAIQVYLLCQVAAGGSGGSGGISNGSGDPTADPTDTTVANLYINDDTGTIWEWPANGPAWVQRT